MIARLAVPSPIARVPRWSWVLSGLAAILIGYALEADQDAVVWADAGDTVAHAAGWLVLRTYGIAVLILSALWLFLQGDEKELARRYLPTVLLPYAAAHLIGALVPPAVAGELSNSFPNREIALTGAFLLAVLHAGQHPRWLDVAAAALCVGVTWAVLVSGRGLPSDVVAAVGMALVAFPLALRARARHGRVLAFGVLPAFRRYELFVMRYVAAADFLLRGAGGGAKREDGRRPAVLDVGCGWGELGCFLRGTEAMPAFELHGIEFDPERAAVATARGYQVVAHDLEQSPLPYPPERFDGVVLSHVIEHLRAPARTLTAVNAVLRPGGLLIVGTPSKPPGTAWIARRAYERRLRRRGHTVGETCQFFTLRSLRALLAESLPEYTVVDVRGFRLFSARDNLPLEDWQWFWRVSTWLGRRLAAFTPEVNVVLRKPGRAHSGALGPGQH